MAVFDLSQPERPQLRAQRFLYPIGARDFFSLKPTPRLVGWAAWEGHLYAGLLGNKSLELHSFDVREGGLPQPVHVLPIAERVKRPISLSGDKAYIQRYWPQELAVLDIADLRRPVEVDYVPNEYFSSGLTMDGDFAYALRPNGIGAYAVAEYGALWRRKTLSFVEEKVRWSIYTPSDMKPYLAPILAGDHICAVMRNNLVVFEALQDD